MPVGRQEMEDRGLKDESGVLEGKVVAKWTYLI